MRGRLHVRLLLSGSIELPARAFSALVTRLAAGVRRRVSLPRIVKAVAAGIFTLLTVPGAMDVEGGLSSVVENVGHSVAELFGSRPEQVVSTKVGEQKPVSLPGGAVVTLNTVTTVHVTARSREDEVRLEHGGEVLVSAAEGVAAKGVRVVVGAIAVETREGELSVRSETDGSCTIRVFRGTATLVALRSTEGGSSQGAAFAPVVLNAGRQAVCNPGKIALSSFPTDDTARLLAWSKGYLEFRDDTIADAVLEFNRYNYQQFVVGDPEIAGIRIGGVFRANNVDGFILALQSCADLRMVSYRAGGRRANVVLLTSVRPKKT